MKKVFCVIFCALMVFSCGKKGGINAPKDQIKPNFEKVFDE